jgi:uncharacterized protein YbjT (DUF2867 family)
MAGTRIMQQLAKVVTEASAAGSALPFRFRFAVRNPLSIKLPDGVDGDAVALDFGDPATFEACLSGVERAFILFHPMNAASMPPFFDACREYGIKHAVMMTVMHADTTTQLPHHTAEKQFIAALKKSSSADYAEVAPLEATMDPRRPLIAVGEPELPGSASAAAGAESAPAAPAVSASSSERPTFTLVRPSWFMENLTRPGIHLPDVLERDELYMPAGNGRVHLVHGSDVGEVVARLLVDNPEGERPHEAHCDTAYAITSAEALTFAEVSRFVCTHAYSLDSTMCTLIERYLPVRLWQVADRSRDVRGRWEADPLHQRMGCAVHLAHHSVPRAANDDGCGDGCSVLLRHRRGARRDTHPHSHGLVRGQGASALARVSRRDARNVYPVYTIQVSGWVFLCHK